MAGYLDESFLGPMSPAKREPIKAVVVYTPPRRKTYRASVSPGLPAVRSSGGSGVAKTPRPRRKQRPYKATVVSGPQAQSTGTQPAPASSSVDEAAFREKALAIGKLNEKRRAKERRFQESQLQKQMRAEAALAKRKARARAKSVRKHKRIARKIWHRLI